MTQSAAPDSLSLPLLLPALPEDAAGLRALLLAAWDERDGLAAERDQALAERDALAEQNDRLRHWLLRLRRMQFGPRAERLPEEQLQLGLEDVEASIAQAEAEVEKRDPELRKAGAAKRRASRGALPAHLPRVEVVVEPESTACPCCRAAMVRIGEDTSERLDVVPAQFRVLVTRRPKLACRACDGVVVQEPAPVRLVEGGLPTEALVAHVLVSRYADHLPLYRQVQIMSRQGVAVDRATLAAWVGYAAAEVAPVVARLREVVLASARVFADETTVPVLDPGRGKTKQGYFWAVARDDRAWGGQDPPAVAYTYAPGRGQQHATALLGRYRGTLQCDGYATYKKLAAPARDGPVRDSAPEMGARVRLAFCWAHARRNFYDLAKSGTAPVASEALARIAVLYRIEDRVRGKPPEERLALRQAESKPLVADMHAWLTAQLARLPGRSPAAGAIRYALNHWDGLKQFLADGRVELDTNTVERAMRPIKLSSKNALFAGSDGGGQNWAAIASLVETCKLNQVEPQAYLAGLLTRLVDNWPHKRIDELMPWHWEQPRQGG